MVETIIAIAVVVLIVGGATAYIIKAKKSGKRCIGCPDGCSCGGKDKKGCDEGSCGSCCHCHQEQE